jgi:ABC-type oligopeptide transport system ATPase subunit
MEAEMADVANVPLLNAVEVTKRFPIKSTGLIRRVSGHVTVVKGISLDVQRGETLGIVGESGSGKTTLVRCLLRAINPSAGSILYESRQMGKVDLALLTPRELKPLRTEMQMIFQDPFASLNPRMTVEDIIGEGLLIHGQRDRKKRRVEVAWMLEKVGMETEHMSRYPYAFSGGQRQRIGIARALVMRPQLVVADEAVSALDVSVQAQVINLLKELQESLQLTYLFVAHDLSVVRHICDRVAVMYLGELVETGPVERVYTNPIHPYTRALLSAIPSLDPDKPLAPVHSGEVGDRDRFAGLDIRPVRHFPDGSIERLEETA